MDGKIIGKRIKEYREKSGISQETLAEAVNVSVTTISNIERGMNYPTFENFIKIANAIHASADQLLGDVIYASSTTAVRELSGRWKQLSPQDKSRATAIMEVLLSEFQ